MNILIKCQSCSIENMVKMPAGAGSAGADRDALVKNFLEKNFDWQHVRQEGGNQEYVGVCRYCGVEE